MRLWMFCLMLLCSHAWAVESLYAFEHESDAKRFQTWTKQVRCLVCQGQSVSESTAPLAMDLKQKIAELIRERQSDEAIQHYLVTRYGERVLNFPVFSYRSWVLWCFPVIGFLCGVLWVFRTCSTSFKNDFSALDRDGFRERSLFRAERQRARKKSFPKGTIASRKTKSCLTDVEQVLKTSFRDAENQKHEP